MADRLRVFIAKHAVILTALVAFVAPLISQECMGLWYQPVEPEGLDEFSCEKTKYNGSFSNRCEFH